jgi:hypothetical protein
MASNEIWRKVSKFGKTNTQSCHILMRQISIAKCKPQFQWQLPASSKRKWRLCVVLLSVRPSSLTTTLFRLTKFEFLWKCILLCRLLIIHSVYLFSTETVLPAEYNFSLGYKSWLISTKLPTFSVRTGFRSDYVQRATVAQSVQCLTTDWTTGVRSPVEAKDFFSSLCAFIGSESHPHLLCTG